MQAAVFTNPIILERIISNALTDSFSFIGTLRSVCKRWNEEVDHCLLTCLFKNSFQLNLNFSSRCRFQAGKIERPDNVDGTDVGTVNLILHFDVIHHVIHQLTLPGFPDQNPFNKKPFNKNIFEPALGAFNSYLARSMEKWKESMSEGYLIRSLVPVDEGGLVETGFEREGDYGLPVSLHWTKVDSGSIPPFVVCMELRNVPATRVTSWLNPTKRFNLNIPIVL